MDATLLLCAALVSAAPAEPGLASSPNFIVHAPSQQLADSMLAKAEIYRRDLATAWLGETLPTGDGPVIVHLQLSNEHDHAAMLPLEKPRRSHHVVWLKTNASMAQGPTLAHELLHCVLATRFGPRLPVFAQEGCASEQDDAEVLAVRRHKLGEMVSTGRWPALRGVLDAPHFAATDQTSYTVACSLADFLFTQGSRPRFLQFAMDGATGDWDSAVRRNYNFDSLATLETQWQRWATSQLRFAARETTRQR